MAPPQAERKAADGGEKAHEVCRPGRDKLSEGKFQSFLPYFLYFTKSRKKSPQAAKNVATATWHRRKAEISRGAAKGFNGVSAKFLSVCADSRFAKPRISFWERF